MSSARYLIAQYTSDLMRKEPRNVGVMVEKGTEKAAQFLGETEPGSIDGRRTRSLNAPDVYAQWVEYWRGQLTAGPLEDLLHEAPEHYRIIRGGRILDAGEDSAERVAEYLFTRLVGGGFAEAVAEEHGAEKAASAGEEGLSDEVENALLTMHLLQLDEEPDVFVSVPYPIVRRRPLEGQSHAVYRPDFVQQNGALHVIETVDLTGRFSGRIRDHSGAVAYMYSDLRPITDDLRAISVVRLTDEAREDEDIQSSLWMLERESEVINWLQVGDRERFLRDRRLAAEGPAQGPPAAGGGHES